MGKKRAFIEVQRKTPGYRPVSERTVDFMPVERRLSDKDVMEQASRCMDCGIPFCHGCGCPLGNFVPEWNELVSRGKWKEALELLLETSSFPEFTGRLCPALCEASCSAGLRDEPVAIRQIEVGLIEKGFAEGLVQPRPPAVRLAQRVAVIGSGPAGLAVADRLNKKGYRVTVYEKDEEPGGILRFGIPDFKLEKSVVERRVELMRVEGVSFETGVTVGEDISFSYLKKRFDAVCLTCGSRQPRDLKAPGRDFSGILFAMDYLSAQNRTLAGAALPSDFSAAGKKVAVIGGGDTGADCVGVAVRQGAVSVTQLEIMPKPPETRSPSTPWPQWPYQLRSSSSHEEGCRRFWNILTKSFSCDHRGRVSCLNAVEVNWEFDPAGRPLKYKEVPGTERFIQADMVLLALGFVGPEKGGLLSGLDFVYDNRGNLAVDGRYMTSLDGVFAAGDMALGPSLVVRAIAQGRAAADAIAVWLREKASAR